MDLPTYTSIWRIEKRLYKLYDIRLPMPLPMVWIVVFVGVMVPWAILLALIGLPFTETPWHVVYLVPPGVITWLSTRPVIEGKRLNELLLSQGRYLSEPKMWCRLRALEEPEEIEITARVWRSKRSRRRAAPARVAAEQEPIRGWPDDQAGTDPAAAPRPTVPAAAFENHRKGEPPKRAISGGPPEEAGRNHDHPVRGPALEPAPEPELKPRAHSPEDQPARRNERPGSDPPAGRTPPPPRKPRPVRVVAAPRPAGERRGVESVVRRAGPARGAGGWRRLTRMIIGGGGRPDTRDTIDETRARAVFHGSRRILVLGCTGGAGQSLVTLQLGHTLALFRDDRVLAVDANGGGLTLTDRITRESEETFRTFLSGLDDPSQSPRGYLSMRAYTSRVTSGLEIIGSDGDEALGQVRERRLDQALRELDGHYKITLIDPAPSLAARMLPHADQLVLVAPASGDAARAVEMTLEWLDGHGCGELRRRAIVVINGWSRRSMTGVERAESVASGRCRAIVRIPWDDRLDSEPRPQTRRAYLALAGVVATALGSQGGGADSVEAREPAVQMPGAR